MYSFLICILVACVSYLIIYKEEIKTYRRLNKKIDFELPNNYIKRNIENDISKVLFDPLIQGVYVLYAPSGIGKTVAIKKILKEIQNNKSDTLITLYNFENKKTIVNLKLRPVYIDATKLYD